MFKPSDREECQRLFDKYYAGRKFFDTLYRELVWATLRPGQRVLDAGCGRYLKFSKELSASAQVVGIDLEEHLETANVESPFGIRGDISRLPFASGQFNLVISRSVIEHLPDPPLVFREFFRVLKPGGKVILVTPNQYDYVSVLASATPYWFHRALVSRIFRVPADDVFPTLYRANTVGSIRRALTSAGFVENRLETINHYPAYLSFSPMLFRIGVLYERLTALPALRGLRGSILCAFEKPALAADRTMTAPEAAATA